MFKFLLDNIWVKSILAFLGGAFLTAIFIPTLVRMANFKNLFDSPDSRKVHQAPIPRLGGVAIFSSFIFISLLVNTFQSFNFFLASSFFLFLIGLKDDLLVISAKAKLLGQLLVALVLSFFSTESINNFYGFFGIFEIPKLLALVFTTFFYLIVINAYNFVDGIDGLAASLALIAAIFYAHWFFLIGQLDITVNLLIFIGTLVVFLYYNLFSKKNKVFLGDTGSMFLGFYVAYISVLFLNQNILLPKYSKYSFVSAPAIVLALMILPIFDFFRVIVVRMSLNKKFYLPDKNHLHHIFYSLGLSHKTITTIYFFYTFVFLLASIYLAQILSIRKILFLQFIVTMLFSFIPEALFYYKKNKRK